MTYLEWYRLKKLSESLTDEEKAFLAGQDREVKHNEIMTQLSEIKKRGSFGRDFVSNIAGNATYNIGIWLIKKLLRKI